VTEGGASCGGAGPPGVCGPPHPPVPKPPGMADPGSPPARPASNARPLADGAVPCGISNGAFDGAAEHPARIQARPAARNKRARNIFISLASGVPNADRGTPRSLPRSRVLAARCRGCDPTRFGWPEHLDARRTIGAPLPPDAGFRYPESAHIGQFVDLAFRVDRRRADAPRRQGSATKESSADNRIGRTDLRELFQVPAKRRRAVIRGRLPRYQTHQGCRQCDFQKYMFRLGAI
jgi:hypothetical protein